MARTYFLFGFAPERAHLDEENTVDEKIFYKSLFFPIWTSFSKLIHFLTNFWQLKKFCIEKKTHILSKLNEF